MGKSKTKMTKRKPAKKRKPATKKTKTDLVDDEGFAVVKGSLLWKYRAIASEWNEAQALMREKLRAEQDELQKDTYAPLRAIRSDIKQMQIDNAGKTAELQQVQNEVADRFGLANLKNCAIDDKTGRIYVLGSDGASVDKPATPRTLKLEERKLKKKR